MSKDTPIGRLLTKSDDAGSLLSLSLVFSGSRTEIDEASIPEAFLPQSGPWDIKGQLASPSIHILPLTRSRPSQRVLR